MVKTAYLEKISGISVGQTAAYRGAGNLNRRGKLERTGGVCGVGSGVVGIGRDLHGLAISRHICTAPKQPPHSVTV